MPKRNPFFGLVLILLFFAETAKGQCIGNTFWNGTAPVAGDKTASGTILGTVQVTVKSVGSFAGVRPGWGNNTSTYGGFTYQSLMTSRGYSFPSTTYTYFKLQTPLDANYIHVRVSDIRGDGFNLEHQRVRGYLNGVIVPANFVDPVNGAFITGGNIINGASTTSALVQSAMRAFFTGPVDSIVVSQTSLSDYVIVELFARCDIILPFQLFDFEVKQINQTMQLHWQTGIEENILAYDIERSANGIHWEKIGSVPSIQTHSQYRSYNFIDQAPLEGKNFYRLASKETDNQIQYSRVIMTRFGAPIDSKNISIFPNPVMDQLTIACDGKNEKIKAIDIYSAEGRLIKKIGLVETTCLINTGNWAKGIYLLHLTTMNGEISFHKIIK